MPAFLSDVVDKVTMEMDRRYSISDREIELIKETVRGTIEAIGLAVSNHGDIYSPAPAPSATPRQQNVHWAGSGRRRRR